MDFRKSFSIALGGLALIMPFVGTASASALSTSCAGVATATNITWTASSVGGVVPIAFLWGNGSTSTMQTITVAPGTYSMTVRATDASSTMATTTCSSTVATTTPPSSDISAQIQALLDQIAKLKAQVLLLIMQHSGTSGSVATSTSGTCFDFHRDLHDGDMGDDVKQLQLTLSSDPSIFPRGLVTGFFGHRTREALRKFEDKFNITSTSTGSFGPQMREHMRTQCDSQDNDHDGMSNATDTDDDNDGIPDTQDPTPLVPDTQMMSTSTSFMNGNHENQGWHGENGKRKDHGHEGDDGE